MKYSCVFLGIEGRTLHVIWIMCCVIMHRTEEGYLKLTFREILWAGVIMLLIYINWQMPQTDWRYIENINSHYTSLVTILPFLIIGIWLVLIIKGLTFAKSNSKCFVYTPTNMWLFGKIRHVNIEISHSSESSKSEEFDFGEVELTVFRKV